MPLPFVKDFNSINEGDLKALITQSVRENQNLEYKSEIWKHDDKETREMLRDITSMANAYGGYFVLGVREDEDGLPVEIVEASNAEKERDRIVSSCLTNISPRLIGIKLRIIGVDGKDILLIFVPRGIRSPYMVTFNGLYQFWIRHDRQKSRMSVDEIRDAILKTENLFTDVKEFIDNRKKDIREEIGNSPYYVMGAIPLSTVREEVVDVLDPNIRDMLRSPPRQGGHGRFNVGHEQSGARPRCTIRGLKLGYPDHVVTELFRNGYLEVRISLDFCTKTEKMDVRDETDAEDVGTLIPGAIIGYPVSFYQLVGGLREYLGLEEPFIGFACLYNTRRLALQEDIGPFLHVDRFSVRFRDKQHLEIPSSQIRDLSNPEKAAKFFVDRIWQAFGWDYAPLWNEEEQRFQFKNR